MGNPTTDLTAKKYVKTEKRGKNTTEARAGSCNYEKNMGVDPQSATVSKYTKKERTHVSKNPAIVGGVKKSVVNKCRNTDPATAGITSKKAGV